MHFSFFFFFYRKWAWYGAGNDWAQSKTRWIGCGLLNYGFSIYCHSLQLVALCLTSNLICYIFTVHAGLIYTYSTGMRQHLYVNQPELVKDMNQCITLALGKPYYVTKRLAPMLGNGILRSNGLIWAQQRKIVAPEFFMDKVKVVDQDLSIYVGFLPT